MIFLLIFFLDFKGNKEYKPVKIFIKYYLTGKQTPLCLILTFDSLLLNKHIAGPSMKGFFLSSVVAVLLLEQ